MTQSSVSRLVTLNGHMRVLSLSFIQPFLDIALLLNVCCLQ